MGYQKINVIAGWFIFIFALVVYAMTMEPTASFWDCGEFIACSFKLEVPHPPGAPFFLLIGRIFSLFAGNDLESVAYWVTMVSVVSSAFSIMFLFWSITHLVKRVLKAESGKETTEQIILTIGAGLIGALTCTFSDSFWFSAVEAEVYGMSAFFTAFVFWAILKWETIEDESYRNKWLILIAYMMGLSIGVHLLNLVTIPALALIIYFKYNQKLTQKGIILTLIASGAGILIIMLGVIPGLPSFAATLEIFFVNALGLPFGSGVIFFSVVFLGALIYGIIYSIRKQKLRLNTVLLAFTFIIIGYASYTVVLIRSNYNPPIDENNPEDVLSFVSYLKREQYGSRPLFYGQYYTADMIEQKMTDPTYMRSEDGYVIKDYKLEYIYDPKQCTIFPRMYSAVPAHKQRYMQITGLKEGEKPNFADNVYFMFVHQIGTMYMRYFLWNFSGRASDIQDASWLGIRGTSDSGLPTLLKENKGRNIYYSLPLLLGLLGIFVQYKKDQKYFWVTLLLFFLTGIALVLYLNSPPIEPRERDYIYSGSYYVFAVWVGFGIVALYDLLGSIIKNKKILASVSLLLGLAIPTVMARANWDDHDRSDRYFSVDSAKNYLSTCAKNAILFTGGDNDTFPLWYVQEVEGFRTDVRVIVLSYFNTDWYIAQMMRDQYDSKALPFSLSLKDYQQGGLNDYLPYVENPSIKGAINAQSYLQLIKQGHKGLQIPLSTGTFYNSVPSKQMFLNVDKEKVLAMGIIPDQLKDRLVDRLDWKIKGRGLEKSDLGVIDLIVTSNWERPIYFNTTSISSINFDIKKYAVQEGIAYRLLPIANPDMQEYQVDIERMYDNVMTQYQWRELDNPNVYYSEDYRHFVLNHRSAFNTLAIALIDAGEYDQAKDVVVKCLTAIPNEAIPYDYFNVQQIGILLEIEKYAPGADSTSADLKTMADNIAVVTSTNAVEMLDYYLNNDIYDPTEVRDNILQLNGIARAYRAAGYKEEAAKYEELFSKYYSSSKIQ